jgi:hypothetical protein
MGRLLTRLSILGVAAGERASSCTVHVRTKEVAGKAADGVRDLQVGDGLYAAAAFIGVEPVATAAWLPTDAKSLEKLVS